MASTASESVNSQGSNEATLNAAASVPESSTVTPTSAAADEVEPRAGEAAFQRLAPLLNALDEEDLPRVNVDITAVIISSFGAFPRLAQMRADIVKLLPHYDLTLFDAFGDIVTALSYVNSAVRASSEDRKDVTAQAQALDAKRTHLYQAAQTLVHFGLLDPKPLESIKTEPGYKPLVSDVSTLVQLIGQNWPKIQGKVPFTLKELNAIDTAALALSNALGLKEQNPEVPREIVMRRRKVFALFRQALTQLRRAVHYLYGEEAVNEIVPSFSNASGRSARVEPEPAVAPHAVTPGSAGAATATPPKQTAGSAAAFPVNNPEQLPITAPFSH